MKAITMQHRTRLNRRMGGSPGLVAALLMVPLMAVLALPAGGQEIVRVEIGADLQEAIDDAVELSRSLHTRVRVEVGYPADDDDDNGNDNGNGDENGDNGNDNGNGNNDIPVPVIYEGFSIPADADLHIRPVRELRPWEVIIQGAEMPTPEGVIEIEAPTDEDAPTDRLVIEGFTLTGANYGVHIREGSPTISRCIIVDNADAGVYIDPDSTNARPFIVNCSIGGLDGNTETGVHADSDSFPRILFSTIILNQDYGVWVSEDAQASITHSIVYMNGRDSAEPDAGGLVWVADFDENTQWWYVSPPYARLDAESDTVEIFVYDVLPEDIEDIESVTVEFGEAEAEVVDIDAPAGDWQRITVEIPSSTDAGLEDLETGFVDIRIEYGEDEVVVLEDGFYYGRGIDFREVDREAGRGGGPQLAYNNVYWNGPEAEENGDYINIPRGANDLNMHPILAYGPGEDWNSPGNPLVGALPDFDVVMVDLHDQDPDNVPPPDEVRYSPEPLTEWYFGKLAGYVYTIEDDNGNDNGDDENGNNDNDNDEEPEDPLDPSQQFQNPMQDRAPNPGFPPYSSEDLERDARPSRKQDTASDDPNPYDIGADEIVYRGYYNPEWFFAEVLPAPVGALSAGDLAIEVGIRGINLAEIVLVPQGGDPANPNHRILLREPVQIDDYTYTTENQQAIATVVHRPGVGVPQNQDMPQVGDIVADGHAALYLLTTDGEIVGLPNNVLPIVNTIDLSDGDIIVEQALTGRHLLIDTIPPRIHVEVYPSEVVSPYDWVVSSNDDRTVQQLSENHAGLPPFPANWPTVGSADSQWNSMVISEGRYAEPLEWGGWISNRFRIGDNLVARPQSAQLFFNTGSVSNQPYPAVPQNLAFTVQVQFIDPVVTVSGPDPVPYSDGENIALAGSENGNGRNRDHYTGLNNREVAGFVDHPEAVIEPVELTTGQGRWYFGTGGDLMPDLAGASPLITASFTPNSATEGIQPVPVGIVTGDIALNEGFSRIQPNATVTHGNNAMTATWTIEDIDWNYIHNRGQLKLELQFAARDRAGNMAQITELIDPLTIWWALETQSTLVDTPPLNGGMDSDFRFQWRLRRGVSDPNTMDDPNVHEGPNPLYTYRIYVNADPEEMMGVYWPIYASPWEPNTVLRYPELMGLLRSAGLSPETNEFHLLFVVQGADEAGNVEPWHRTAPWWSPGGDLGDPGEPLFDHLDGPVDLRGAIGELRYNWIDELPNMAITRWGREVRLGTRVTPVFYYGEDALLDRANDERLGSDTYIVMPGDGRNVHAEFLVRALLPELEPTASAQIEWALYSDQAPDGYADDSGMVTLGNQREARIPLHSLGDINRLEPVRYTFRARARVNGVTAPTWASVSFVVTPFAADPKVDSDRQPTRIYEEQ